jgi:branched-chain amino acid transport system permease protein
LVGLVAFALLVPVLFSPVYIGLATEVMIAAIFALSFNILYGYTGLPSFGHAAYYGIGAYATAMGVTEWALPLWASILLAPIAAAAAALVIGVFCVRLRVIYFAMLTMAFSQLLFYLVQQSYDFTGGDNGLRVPGVPDGLHSTLHPERFFYVAAVVTVVSVAGMYLVTHSPFGQALRAVRENPTRAEAVGINVRRYQLASFVVAGLFAGVAGLLYALYAQFIFPQLFFWTKGAEPLLMSIFGGVGYFLGPVAGAISYQLLYFFVIKNTEYVKLIVGSVIILVVLLGPRGILGMADDLMGFVRRRRQGDPVDDLRVGILGRLHLWPASATRPADGITEVPGNEEEG